MADKNTNQKGKALLPVLGGLTAGLLVGLLLGLLAGESPWSMLDIFYRSLFGSIYDFGTTLYYVVPLLLTGLSVGVAFRAKLFNIGAEGQLTIGAMAATITGILFPEIPFPWAPLVAIVVGFAAAAVWGFIPGWLLVRRGSHEVITTIMLNFIAAGITSYLTMEVFKNPSSQAPETAAIGASYQIKHYAMFDDAPLGPFLWIALLVAVMLHFVLKRSVFGYRLRVVGDNETAARDAGIRSDRVKIWVMALAGGLAGLAGVSEMLGTYHHFRLGFSPGYGFLGIAVALLGRGKPIPIIFAAVLFGALFKGATDLDFETEAVTKELALIIQGAIILFVSAEGWWRRLVERKETR